MTFVRKNGLLVAEEILRVQGLTQNVIGGIMVHITGPKRRNDMTRWLSGLCCPSFNYVHRYNGATPGQHKSLLAYSFRQYGTESPRSHNGAYSSQNKLNFGTLVLLYLFVSPRQILYIVDDKKQIQSYELNQRVRLGLAKYFVIWKNFENLRIFSRISN